MLCDCQRTLLRGMCAPDQNTSDRVHFSRFDVVSFRFFVRVLVCGSFKWFCGVCGGDRYPFLIFGFLLFFFFHINFSVSVSSLHRNCVSRNQQIVHTISIFPNIPSIIYHNRRATTATVASVHRISVDRCHAQHAKEMNSFDKFSRNFLCLSLECFVPPMRSW